MSQHTPPPTPLHYGGPTPPPQPRFPSSIQFCIAFFGGIGLSFLAWMAGPHAADRTSLGWLVYAVLIFKCCGGITFICFRGYRGYGAGLLVSLPIGVMIFIVAACSTFHW